MTGFPTAAGVTGPPSRRWIWTCSLLLGLLCLTRPDGAVFAAGLIAGLVAARWRRGGQTGLAVRLTAGPVVAVAGQLAFRLAYYGNWLPNTALVKLGWSSRRLVEGWAHVLEGWAWLQPLTALAAAGVIHAFTVPQTRPRALVVLIVGVVWSVYLAFVGGDVFPAFRHFPPLALVAAAMVGLGLESLALRAQEQRRSRSPRPLRPVRGARLQFFPIWLAVVLLAIPFGWRQLHGPHADEVATNRYVWHGRAIALTLRTAFEDRDPLFAVTAAGCLPYWSGFRSLDLLGLCDEHIARNRPESFGTGPLAHELGDPNYLLERAPDLMFFGAAGPGAGRQLGGRYGHDLLADPRFRGEYHSLCLRIDDAEPFRCYVWMRATSSVLGWRLRGDRLEIPAYFFNGNPDSEAVLNQAGTLGLTVSPDVPAYLRLGDLGREILEVKTVPPGDPSAPVVRLSFFHDHGGALCLALEADGPSWVESVALILAP